MKNALQSRGASSKKFFAGTAEDYARKSGASSSKSRSLQEQLFIEADDRPERKLGWIYNPSAPATEEELREFFSSMQAMLAEDDGRVQP
jgi:hypothetical protein